MKNILKAQLYQLKREHLALIIFVCILIAMVGAAFFGFGEGETLSGSETAGVGMSFMAQIAVVFSAIITGTVCCGDFPDRTANYEIMSGHTRREIFTARAVLSIAAGSLSWLVLMVIPLLICTAVSGWGTQLAAGELVLRMVLMLFPVIRIICEYVLTAFIVRNPYIVMGAGYVAFILGGVSGAFSKVGSYFLGMTNLNILSSFDRWMTFGLSGGMNLVFESSVGAKEIAGTVIFSLIFGAAALYIAYRFFEKDDIN